MKVKPALVADDAPFFYANYIEVGHSNYDFTLLTARIPSKLSAEQQQRAAESGVLEIPAELQIVMPPKVAAGLIKALQVQIADFEKTHGPITPESTS